MNRWEPWNGVEAVKTNLIDAVQVIYNIFDQNPEDELFPACEQHDVAVIARVPFDEGTLTGTLTKESRWPEGDWRNEYFVPENLIPAVDRADALKPIAAAAGLSMPEMALRFILNNPTVSTIIPGMRRIRNVEANIAASDAGPLPASLHDELPRAPVGAPANFLVAVTSPPGFAARAEREPATVSDLRCVIPVRGRPDSMPEKVERAVRLMPV